MYFPRKMISEKADATDSYCVLCCQCAANRIEKFYFKSNEQYCVDQILPLSENDQSHLPTMHVRSRGHTRRQHTTSSPLCSDTGCTNTIHSNFDVNLLRTRDLDIRMPLRDSKISPLSSIQY